MTTRSTNALRALMVSTALLLLISTSANAARYEIDSAATKTTYETKYLGFIPVRGVFTRMTGNLNYEPLKPATEREPSIHVIIDATTLTPSNFDSESKRRMLRGPEFFDVNRFPTIEFKSTRFRYEGEKLIAIDGNITLVGTTKPVTLTVMKSACEAVSNAKSARCTASTEVTVKRFDFGMKGWSGTVSDDVKIAVELVASIVSDEKVAPSTMQTTAPAISSRENK